MKFQKTIFFYIIIMMLTTLILFFIILVNLNKPTIFYNNLNLNKPVDNVILVGVDGVSSANVFKNKYPNFQKIINKGIYSKTALNNGTIHSDSNWSSVLTATSDDIQKKHWNNHEVTDCSQYLQQNQDNWWIDNHNSKCYWNPLKVPPLSIMKYIDMFNTKNSHNSSQYYGTYDFTMDVILKSELYRQYASRAWNKKIAANIQDNIKENINNSKKKYQEGFFKQDKVLDILQHTQLDRMSIYNCLPGSYDRLVKIDQAAVNLFLNDTKDKKLGPLSFLYLASTDLLAHAKYGNSGYYDQYLLSNVDMWLENILNALERAEYDNYLLIFVSDHGHIGKNHTFYAPLELQIPFIMYHPHNRKNGILGYQISNMDLTPIIASALGLPILKTYKNILGEIQPWWNYQSRILGVFQDEK
ncbi:MULTISPECIES: alkaline phosphatase family protein [unclassified Spiroplasma]|uniref:alkaline phosphatase family protein n=1 Tax=unclassified Spiroplasma TaxID=2637901 RepID=UPI00313C2074